MLPILSNYAVTELNNKLNEVQRALAITVDTQSDTHDAPGSESDSADRPYALTVEARKHLIWCGEIVRVPQEDTVCNVEVARHIRPQSPHEVGLDPLEHPVYIDAEMRSAELAAKLSLEKMFPGLTEDIGELFG